MSRRSKSIDEAVMRAVHAGNISVKTAHDWIYFNVGGCEEKEVRASLNRMVKQGRLVREQPLKFYKLPSRKNEP